MALAPYEDPATLALATIKAITCHSELATRQLLRHIYGYEQKVAARMIQKIYSVLQPPDQYWLLSTITPGMSFETYGEAAVRVSKNPTQI